MPERKNSQSEYMEAVVRYMQDFYRAPRVCRIDWVGRWIFCGMV